MSGLRLPKQWRHWCQSAGLRLHFGGKHRRKSWAWLYLKGHGRVWRVNCRAELECGDTYQDFDRWALCDIRSAPLPKSRDEFKAAVRALVSAHTQESA